MKQLLILRHAKSSWDFPTLSDHERPLSKRGKRDAPRMGRLLLGRNLIPDLIFSSTAVRAHTTAESVSSACHYEGPIHLERALYHGEVEDYLSTARQAPADAELIMMVGHNPGMEEFVALLAGHSVRMPTAAMAWFQLPLESWAGLGASTKGDLQHVWRPKEL